MINGSTCERDELASASRIGSTRLTYRFRRTRGNTLEDPHCHMSVVRIALRRADGSSEQQHTAEEKNGTSTQYHRSGKDREGAYIILVNTLLQGVATRLSLVLTQAHYHARIRGEVDDALHADTLRSVELDPSGQDGTRATDQDQREHGVPAACYHYAQLSPFVQVQRVVWVRRRNRNPADLAILVEQVDVPRCMCIDILTLCELELLD